MHAEFMWTPNSSKYCIIYTSNRRHSKNSRIGLKNLLQSGVVAIDHVLHAQQSSYIPESHQCWLCCALTGISLLHTLRWYQWWT